MIQGSPRRLGASTRWTSTYHVLILSSCLVGALRQPVNVVSQYDNDAEPRLERFEVEQLPLHDRLLLQTPLSLPSSTLNPQTTNGASTYGALLHALHVMESHFFSVSQGTWPDAIDWTAAVMGTQVSSSLSLVSEHESFRKHQAPGDGVNENTINRYFTQVTSFYFGENAFSLRTQAYDDMLWVVLGWLESIKFVNLHSNLHYAHSPSHSQNDDRNSSWYARQFVPQFAHRARLFYDLASKGWDTTLCGGGMVWNPHLAPYKNAITNELFIAASVGMYLYFPGDDNASPFGKPFANGRDSTEEKEGGEIPPAKGHDDQYLQNAIEGYKWLKDSGMRNSAGLFVDGFHIRGWRGGRHGSNGTRHCDLRDEKVYTYNQGVILSGLRGLWEATGDVDYLEDGHELINDVITATGWDNRGTDLKYRWAGLGRDGVMEEQCDWSGTCSQNGQTFKGIFFHHFTIFCSPLPSLDDEDEDGNRPWLGDEETRALHQQSCDGYGAWVMHNARAASLTRDDTGEFGEWWGRPSRRTADQERSGADMNFDPPSSDGGTDYRNEDVPTDEVWRLTMDDHRAYMTSSKYQSAATESTQQAADLNDRGRGRTVETQSGGVAVLRAAWKLVDSRKTTRPEGVQ